MAWKRQYMKYRVLNSVHFSGSWIVFCAFLDLVEIFDYSVSLDKCLAGESILVVVEGAQLILTTTEWNRRCIISGWRTPFCLLWSLAEYGDWCWNEISAACKVLFGILTLLPVLIFARFRRVTELMRDNLVERQSMYFEIYICII